MVFNPDENHESESESESWDQIRNVAKLSCVQLMITYFMHASTENQNNRIGFMDADK